MGRGIVSFQLNLDGGAGNALLNPDARGPGVGAMRKRFTIKPIGAEHNHPKFAGVNIASFFFFHSKWLATAPLPTPTPTPTPAHTVVLLKTRGRGGNMVQWS